MLAPIGTRLMTSTPAAIATSYCPDITPWAAKCIACWDEPHWRSTVVPGTDSGRPAASTAFLPMLTAWAPTWVTQPMMTSSTIAGSRSFRTTSDRRVSAARSTGCHPDSLPCRRPPAVRIASTITAFGMVGTSLTLLFGP